MEIERKWLIKGSEIELSTLERVEYERHFLYNQGGNEIRIQNKGGVYEFERKSRKDSLSRESYKIVITRGEYDALVKLSIASISRYSYLYNSDPDITIKQYLGDYKGLLRVEVEFRTIQEASSFLPFEWFGKEITDTRIGNDRELIKMGRDEFLEELNKYI